MDLFCKTARSLIWHHNHVQWHRNNETYCQKRVSGGFPVAVIPASNMSVLWLSDVDCGPPSALPHSHMLWNNSTRMGTEVHYECYSGYHNVGKGNVSVCTADGVWERPSVLCQGTVTVLTHTLRTSKNIYSAIFSYCIFNSELSEAFPCVCLTWMLLLIEIMCGNPPQLEFTEQIWNHNSGPGSAVFYFCKEGFKYKGGENISMCRVNGQWTHPTMSCQGNWHVVYHETCLLHLIKVFFTLLPHRPFDFTDSLIWACPNCDQLFFFFKIFFSFFISSHRDIVW